MAIADRHGLPVGLFVLSASPHEVTLVEDTLDGCYTRGVPEKVIGDGAYDSDPLDERLLGELIAPHKSNRKRERTQDGRPLRRYKRRWKIERLFAWLQNFRRIVTRYEWDLFSWVLCGYCLGIFEMASSFLFQSVVLIDM